MIEIKNTNMVLSRTRHNQVYIPYAKKKAYFEAIAGGNADIIDKLAENNRGFTAALSAKCTSKEEAAGKMRYSSVCAASELCLTAVRSGMLDMVAYDIRDELLTGLDAAATLEDCYDLVHSAAREYAQRMSYILKEKNYSSRLVRMMTYIREHLGEKIELAAIAEHVGVSRTYASAVFKDELGITISDFILQERMTEAGRLLRETDLSVADISGRLAFCSQSYFTKRFTETNGITPLEYRKQRG